MTIPFHIQRLLDLADFQHVSSECHENWTYARTEHNQEIRWDESPTPEYLTSHEDLKCWLERKGPNGNEFQPPSSQKHQEAELIGGFRLLIQRTRIKRELDGRCENPTAGVKPLSHLTMQWQDRETFHKVAAALNFPPTYVSALYHASGHAESSEFIKRSDGSEYIGFLAQNTDYNWNPWSLAISYNPLNRITTGILCAEQARGIDITTILSELTHSSSPSTHPALLPIIMFGRLLQSSFNHYSRLHKAMTFLEDELSRTECRGCTLDEDLKYRGWLRRLNGLKKQQASRDGRHQFWRHFYGEIQRLFEMVEGKMGEGVGEIERKMRMEQLELENRVRTISGKFASLDGRDANSKARIDAQLDLLYNTIQQNESRSQYHIASTMSKDSSDVAFLTKLGTSFLPASAVGSFLGIQTISIKSNPEIAIWYFSGTIILIAVVLFVPFLQMLRRYRIQSKLKSLPAYMGE